MSSSSFCAFPLPWSLFTHLQNGEVNPFPVSEQGGPREALEKLQTILETVMTPHVSHGRLRRALPPWNSAFSAAGVLFQCEAVLGVEVTCSRYGGLAGPTELGANLKSIPPQIRPALPPTLMSALRETLDSRGWNGSLSRQQL